MNLRTRWLVVPGLTLLVGGVLFVWAWGRVAAVVDGVLDRLLPSRPRGSR